MRSKIVFIVISLLFYNGIVVSWTVYDPLNFGQNSSHFVKEVAHFAKQIEDIERTAARVQFEISAAQRLVDRLKKLDLTSISSISRQINSLRSRARSIGYAYEGVANQFERFYGRGGMFSPKLKDWQKQSDDSIKDAMVSQGLLERSEKHMVDLDKVVEDKRNSQGDSDTLQALGEINAIQSKQLADLSEIIATDARAKQSVIMEERSKQKNLQDYEAHLMKDFNVHRKSRPLTHFPSLGTTAPRR